MTTQTVYARFVQGQTGLSATLREGLPTELVATAASVTEQAGADPDPGLYAIVFSTLVPAGKYTLPITKDGTVYATRSVTLTGVDGESAVAVGIAVELDSASRAAILTQEIVESYPADLAAPTLAQAVMLTLQHLQQKSVSGTTVTIKKLDKSTTAATYTLDSATDPTSITRAS